MEEFPRQKNFAEDFLVYFVCTIFSVAGFPPWVAHEWQRTWQFVANDVFLLQFNMLNTAGYLSGHMLQGILFSDLRSLMGTTVMTLLATTFMTQLIYVIGVGGVREKSMCQAISHSLQFLHLCLLAWLLVLCKDTMTSLSSSDASEPPSPSPRQMCVKFISTSLWAWGAPAAHVAATYYATSSLSLPTLYKVNCWFIEKRLYLLFYGFPAIVLLSTCACLMVRARVRLAYTLSLETRPKHRAKLSRAKKLQVSLCSKLTANLFCLDIVGLVFVMTGHNFAWIAYNFLHSLQGLIMALCSTCNSQVLSVYSRKQRRRRSSGRLLSTNSNLSELDWSPLPTTV